MHRHEGAASRQARAASRRPAVRRAGAAAAVALLAAACAGRSLAQDAGAIATSRPGAPIALGAQATEVDLVVVPAAAEPSGGEGPARTVGERLRALDEGRDIYLTLIDVDAPRPPGIVYNVYLRPDGAPAPVGPDDPHHAGTLTFFNAGADPREVSFNVTDLVARVLATAAGHTRWHVLLVPAGTPEADGHRVGRIVLTAR